MDFFDPLASTPPRGKKRKIGEHGESPQLTPDKCEVCEGAHSTDVKNDVFEEEHGPALQKSGRLRRDKGVSSVLGGPEPLT